ncbi:MAG: Ig-like domain-containing protein [Chloroflexi bacterium]|nr:Ig-like domain-containing protein [Chloroflexota bacterium]MBP7042579.1 Ig-like domain-containing protein [Chloroflexota bacterium]
MNRSVRRVLLLSFVLAIVLFWGLTACRQEERPETAVTISPTSLPATPTPKLPTPTAKAIGWPPQVVYSSPAPGETVLLDGAMTIRFDQPMDQTAVEAAFSISPAPQAGQFAWPRPDTLVYTPVQSWERQQTYKVRIDQTAVSQAGIPLAENVELSLQTVGYLAVSQVMPDGGGSVAMDTAVTVIFNRPVASLVTGAQQAGLPQPLQFEPPVDGLGEWLSSSIYRFTPNNALLAGTNYQVTIPAGLADTTGAILAADYAWNFRTASPKVDDVLFPPGSTPYLDPAAAITVTFNLPMDPATTETAVSLSPAPADGLTFAWDDAGQMLTVRSARPLELATTYTLTISSDAQAQHGGAALVSPRNTHFRTYPYPAITETTPAEGELWNVNDWYWDDQPPFIDFATPMDTESFAGRITIQPSPAEFDYTYQDWIDWEGEAHHRLSLDFAELRDQPYTITLSADVQDIFGNRLGRDFTLHFNTIPYLPVASLNFPPSKSMMLLSDSFPTAVDLVYRNVPTVTLNLYEAKLPVFYLTHGYEIGNYKPPFQPLRTWTIPSTAVADEAVIEHVQLADGGALPLGIYFVETAVPGVETGRYSQTKRGFIIVADTNLAVKQMLDTTYVWATDIATGAPSVGRAISLHDEDGSTWGTAVTDANGLAAIPFDGTRENHVVAVSGEPGAAGFGLAYAGWSFRGNSTSTYIRSEEPYAMYIYTDRPIYRPGDTVYFKGILREQDYGRYQQPALDDVTITVEGWWPAENTAIYRESLPLDAHGAINGQFTLPQDIDLGPYRFDAYSFSGNISENYPSFEVAEYRKPEMLITVTPERQHALMGEAVDVTVQAAYYFGGPAADLPIAWEINYYELSGEAVTDRHGRLQLTIPTDFFTPTGSARTATLSVEVSGVGELPLGASTSVVFHPAEVLVRARPQRYINQAGQEMNLPITTTDWQGNPAPNRPVTVTISQVDWTWGINQYGNDGWASQLTTVATLTTKTGSNGQISLPFTPPAAGEYRITAVAADANGRLDTAHPATFYAIGQGYVRYPLDKFSLSLAFDQEEYAPGDTARLLIQSDFSEPMLAWLTIEQGPRLEQQIITLSGASHVLEMPVTAAYAPEVRVTVTAVQGTNGGAQFAAMRQGQATMTVSPEQLDLTLTLTPDDEQFLPGADVRYDILVTDYLGRPVQADLSLALVDLAVLSLKPDNASSILTSFYSSVRDVSADGGSLFLSGEGLKVVIPNEPGGGGGGGGGGGNESRPVYGLDDDTRRDFPDTAYWRAAITTDANGRAQIAIPLPDSLTTWRLSSKAVSHEGTLVGQESVDIQVNKPLLLRPVTPRFFTVGDEMNLGSFVHNNTAASLDVSVTLEADGVELLETAVQTITLAAAERGLVQWPIRVQDVDAVDLTFRAVAGDYADATKPTFGLPPDHSLPVYRYVAPDIAGASGVLDNAGQVVEAILLPNNLDPDNSQLQVQLHASLAAGMVAALEDTIRLTRYTNCVTAVTDRLLANAASQTMIQQLQLPDVPFANRLDTSIAEDVAELKRLVLPDGGWSWCGGRQPDAMTTALALFSLAQAEKTGQPIGAEDLVLSLNYLTSQARSNPAGLSATAVANRRAYYLYVLAVYGRDVRTQLNGLLAQDESLDPYGTALALMAYNLTLRNQDAPAPGGQAEEPAPIARDARQQMAALLADLNNTAIVSAAGAHWQDAEGDWRNLNSDVRGTAVVIHALTQTDPTNPLLPLAARWLMSSRTAVAWATTYETAWSLLALSDWMVLTGELQPDFAYAVQANETTLAEDALAPDMAADTVDVLLPAADLRPDEMNLLTISRGAGNGRLYYTTYLQTAVPATAVPAINRGIIVERAYYDAVCNPHTTTCQPITQIAAGQQVRVQLNIQALSDLVYLTIDDPIPAGTEALDPHLLTVSRAYAGEITRTNLASEYEYGYWGWWYFDAIQYHDDRVQFTSEFLPAGTYQYTYYLQALLPGAYQVRPTLAQQTFLPEVYGRSAGAWFTVIQE